MVAIIVGNHKGCQYRVASTSFLWYFLTLLTLVWPGDGMVDIGDLKSPDRKVVPVRIRPGLLSSYIIVLTRDTP